MTTSAWWARTTCGATCPSAGSTSAWIPPTRCSTLSRAYARPGQFGCRTTVSLPRGWSSAATDWLRELTDSWTAAIEFVQETDDELADRVRAAESERVRFAAPERVPEIVFQAAAASGVYVARAPVLIQGRVELLWYLREQSISIDYHRYGNLSIREGEQRLTVS